MKDRRVRLRPKNGARALYYSSVGIVNTRGSNLFDTALPYLNGSKPLSSLVPNIPNIISSIGSSINNLPNVASNVLTNVSNTINNLPSIATNLVKNTASSFIGNLSRSFGKGQGLGSLHSNINILEPLSQTDGLVFPFTPTVTYVQSVEYTNNGIDHTNQEFLAYTRTNSPQISVSGQFTVQNSFEASYALACIHFLRTVVKMSFGSNSQYPSPGTPPPTLLFSGYGEYMFNELPVLITSFSLDYPDDVDYVIVPNTDTVVPSSFKITISLSVQNNPEVAREFSLDRFRSGSLMKQGGWI